MLYPNDIYDKFSKIPFLKLLPPLILGVIVADSVNFNVLTLLAVYALFLVGFIIFRRETPHRIFSFLLIFFIGMTSVKVLAPEEDIPQNVRIIAECKITDNLVNKGKWQNTTAKVEAYRLASLYDTVWQKSNEYIILYIDSTYKVSIGDNITCYLYVNPLDTVGGQSGYARTMRSRGYLGRAYVSAGNILYKTKYAPETFWQEIIFASKRVQRVLNRRIIENKEEARDSGVAMALLTGDKQLLDSNIREAYSKAGFSHVLAISGLHLGIIFLFLNFFLSPLLFVRKGKIIRTIMIIIILWTYCFITGLSASVMRSAFMLSLMQISFLTTRNYNSYNALFSSAFVLILVNPYFIYDMSFQMSYLAILTILFFFPRLKRWSRADKVEYWLLNRSKGEQGFKKFIFLGARRGFQFVTGAILVGISAQIGVTPITGYFFGIFPLLNIFINPIIMVLMMQIMFMGFIYLTIFDTPAGTLVGEIFSTLISALNNVVEWTSSFRVASIEYGNLSLIGLYISYAVIILIMIIIKWFEYRKIRLAHV